jgi:hypothetical protein
MKGRSIRRMSIQKDVRSTEVNMKPSILGKGTSTFLRLHCRTIDCEITSTSAASSSMHATFVRFPCDSAVPRRSRAGQEQPEFSTDSCLTALILGSHGFGLSLALLALSAFESLALTLRTARSSADHLSLFGHSGLIWPYSLQP